MSIPLIIFNGLWIIAILVFFYTIIRIGLFMAQTQFPMDDKK